ncbi:MAG TPA: cytochrome c peroxidase [Candidatus Limnocylindria bacterium]|nr:cytochrome c peroxidase [Candidatus Limnocylindria bacterium]
MRVTLSLAVLAALGLLGGCLATSSPSARPSTSGQPPTFTPDELELLRALWIGSLPPLPDDPANRHADDPAAAALGESFFFDARFSVNGRVSCSSCHQPELAFTDGLPRGRGIGETPRSTMSVLGTAYAPFLFWDGRKDSQWAQALGPLENALEHGGNRGMYAHVIADHYRAEYEATFGPLPDLSDTARFPQSAGPVDDPQARAAWDAMTPADRDAVTAIYVNMGKAIAAYERGLLPTDSRFDPFVESLLGGSAPGAAALTDDEVEGLRLFIGEAQCTNCHNGPLFTNQSFHNTGVPPLTGRQPDPGRGPATELLKHDEFNCLSRWSDAAPDQCTALRFLRDDPEALAGAFKPPSLRNVSTTGPYMHAGQLATLDDVLRHYWEAPAAEVGHSELEPLDLTDAQVAQLVAFLRSLDDMPSDP